MGTEEGREAWPTDDQATLIPHLSAISNTNLTELSLIPMLDSDDTLVGGAGQTPGRTDSATLLIGCLR